MVVIFDAKNVNPYLPRTSRRNVLKLKEKHKRSGSSLTSIVALKTYATSADARPQRPVFSGP